MKKYNHACSLNFEVASDDPDNPTEEELLVGLLRRLVILSKEGRQLKEMQTTCHHGLGLQGNCEPYDTYEFSREDSYKTWLAKGRPAQLSSKQIVEIFFTADGGCFELLTDDQVRAVTVAGEGDDNDLYWEPDWDMVSPEQVDAMAEKLLTFPNVVLHLLLHHS